MSGIAGIFNFDGAPIEPGLIEKMTAAISYRGPDGVAHWVRGPAALGHCMLRTTQESLKEAQPLANEDETLVLVLDGWLSNWQELRAELLAKGARLRTRADAELVLRSYETWREECLAHLDGDFAFLIWDTARREAFCARDRFGNRPFAYRFDGKTLAFASELHPILALPFVHGIPNEGMIAEIMADEVMTQEETIWSGIQRLAPAHFMTVNARGVRSARYWRPDVHGALAYKRDEDYFEHYRALLFDTVRRQSRSQAPAACEVSGGLDSSAIFCVAEHLRRKAQLPAPGLQGYTLNLEYDPAANEISYARDVGNYLGLTIGEVPPALHPLKWYADFARDSRNVPGFPNGSSATSLYEAASENGHRIVLAGVGGDQFLTGSLAYYFEDLRQGRLGAVRRAFAEDVKELGRKRASLRLFRYGLAPFVPMSIRNLVRPAFRPLFGGREREYYWLSARLQQILKMRRENFRAKPRPTVERRGQLELFTALDSAFDVFGREFMDCLAARHGLEIRRPFYAKEFVEFAFVTPDRLRSIGSRIKVIHTESLKGFLPESVRQRQTKAEFSCVFRAPLQSLGEYLTVNLPGARPEWFDRGGMKRLWQGYLEEPGAGWHGWCLWGSVDIGLSLGA